jgi:hypothetical protein
MQDAINNHYGLQSTERAHVRIAVRPTLDYAKALTDDTGMIQHGIGGVPDPHTGYTTDDNARALLAMVRLWRGTPSRRSEIEPLLRIYLRYMVWAHKWEGTCVGWFTNKYAYDRRALDEHGTDDCLGRCVWALAESAGGMLPNGAALAVQSMLRQSRSQLEHMRSPHAFAYALLGLCRMPSADADPDVRYCADALAGFWREYSAPGWRWFEPQMTYDNARYVEAMLRAAIVTDDATYLRIAMDSLEFLTECSFDPSSGSLSPVGNRTWWRRGEEKSVFDQQTLEAGAYAELYHYAADSLAKPELERLGARCLDWFHGDNIQRLPVYDHVTGACCDALTQDGINLNQGAESLLSYLLAESAILRVTSAGESAGIG